MATDPNEPPTAIDRMRFYNAVENNLEDVCTCTVDDQGQISVCDFHNWLDRTPQWFNRLVWIRREKNQDMQLRHRQGDIALEFTKHQGYWQNGVQHPDWYEPHFGYMIRVENEHD